MIRMNQHFLIVTGLLLSLQMPTNAIHFSRETLTNNPEYALLGAATGTGAFCFGAVCAVNSLGIAGMSYCLNKEKGGCTFQKDEGQYTLCSKHKYCRIIHKIGIPVSYGLLGLSIGFAVAGIIKMRQ